ncbi:MAG TPA: imidazolonepropionase [Vicinamibacterales bacterium]|nr:imidazolonepropionase [Vicinamibacterales bacterium]
MPDAPRQPADFLIEHASVIATCAGPVPRRGVTQGDIAPLLDGVIAASQGEIVFVGPAASLAGHVEVLRGATRIDARGCTVVPGFVDPHTHVVYAGDRRDELRRRLAGATYAEIAATGGGIVATVAATRSASDDELVAATRGRLDEMLACGTTTCEAKSGYGLSTDSELRMLRTIRALDHDHDMDIVPTFMGAHEIPIEFRDDADAYVSLVVNEMIPAVADEGLADWCDVFCERGVFTPGQATTILEAGARAGLLPRIHAEELARSGGADVAARVGARSADHLLYATGEDADALADAGVCATLLPASAFYLKAGRFAPARMLIERNVPVALGTDLNPGGGYAPSMPFAMTLACFAMGMTLEEALVAATVNAAWSLDRAHAVGSLAPGRLMDAVILKGDLANLVRVGAPVIRMVVKRGKVVFWQG